MEEIKRNRVKIVHNGIEVTMTMQEYKLYRELEMQSKQIQMKVLDFLIEVLQKSKSSGFQVKN